ncbi:MAG: discoidin domain-containing protein, partial [Nannocystaceae bacterium]
MNTHRTVPSLFVLALSVAGLAGCDVEPAEGLDGERELEELAEDSDGEDFEPEAGPDDLLDELDDDATFSAPINLALGKPTSQSTTYLGADAARAVDGNTDGNWGGGSVTHTNLGTAGWWQVDLQSIEPIGEIVIHNRTDCCALLGDFDVKVSADGTTWETFHEAGIADAKTRVLIDRQARYVRIENPNTLHVAEVEVFRTTNLAFGKPATQSSTGFGAPASRAVDGNTNGSFGAGSVSHTAVDGPGQWWQVDLQTTQNIGQVVIFNRTDCCAQKLHDFTLRVSTDGTTWEDILYEGAAGAHAIVPVNHNARYVRIENGDGYLHLAEVQVFEAPTMPGLSYGRGVGWIPSYGCEPGDQYDAGLCYEPCATGYTNVLNLCYEDCATGYTDMGLYCMNYGVAGWPSYWKNIYDRGVGTLPVPDCGAGNEYDAGLCYPVCDPGYHGVGPVCWLDGITFEDLAAVPCDAFRIPALSHLAEQAGVAMTAGAGLSVAVGATASTEVGFAYGTDGEFGCYLSGCVGVSTDIGISGYGALGAFDDFGSISGDSLVSAVGVGISVPYLPVSVGGSAAVVANTNGEAVGATVAVVAGIGLDDTP